MVGVDWIGDRRFEMSAAMNAFGDRMLHPE
jgi:hypothetical protein